MASGKKWPKLKKIRKPPHCGTRGVRVNRQVKNLRKVPIVVPCNNLDFFSLSNAKRFPVKAFLKETLVSLILEARFFLKKKIWKVAANFNVLIS